MESKFKLLLGSAFCAQFLAAGPGESGLSARAANAPVSNHWCSQSADSDPLYESTCRRIVDLVASHLGVDRKKIFAHSRVAEDLGADSLDAVEFVMALEEEFDITISDDMAKQVVTVADMIDLVLKIGYDPARHGSRQSSVSPPQVVEPVDG